MTLSASIQHRLFLAVKNCFAKLFFRFLFLHARSLGVHCSKVRSLTLDSWEPELLKVSLSSTLASSLFLAQKHF